MHKLITYLKNGKDRGLKTMLVFSLLATLLSWGMNYSALEQIPYTNPSFPTSYIFGLHFGFILAAFVLMWLLYLIVVGFSTLISKAFRLKLPKGSIWRATLVTLIILFLSSLLLTLTAYFLSMFGEIGLLFYPVAIMIIIPVLLVTLIVMALAEPKEGKKKK